MRATFILFGFFLFFSLGAFGQQGDEEESMEGPAVTEPSYQRGYNRKTKPNRNTNRAYSRSDDSNRSQANNQNSQNNIDNQNQPQTAMQRRLQEKLQGKIQRQNRNGQSKDGGGGKCLNDKIKKHQEQQQNQNQSAQQAIQKLQKEMQNGGLMKSVSPEMIRKVFSQYKGRSDKDIENALMKKYEGQTVGTLFKEFPKVRLFLAKCFKDDNAIPNLAKILQNKKKLLYFLLFNIGTLIFGWLLKRSFRRDQKSSILRDIKLFFFRMGLVYTARIAILISFFGKELKPIWNILIEVLKS